MPLLISGSAPIALALLAAVLFGIGGVLSKRGLAHVDARTGAMISIGVTVLIYALSAPWWMRAADWFTPGFWVFVLAGLFHPMLSMYMALEAISRAAPTVAATFASTAPLFAAFTAIVFLGESMSLWVALGTLGTVAGVMTLSWARGGAPRQLQAALLFATGAAVVRGLNHTMGKWGLELLPNVFMASFVSFSVSFIGMSISYRMRRRALPARLPRRALMYFGVLGVLISVAIVCVYAALASGSVVVVSPIVAAYPLFTLLAAVAAGEDRISARLLAGVLLVVAGVGLISAGVVS